MPASVLMEDAELAQVRMILRRHLPEDARVFVFGSRATGTARPFSDLDLLLEGARPIERAIMMRLQEDFEEAPLDWRVDLVDRATVSDGFAAIVDAQKVPLP